MTEVTLPLPRNGLSSKRSTDRTLNGIPARLSAFSTGELRDECHRRGLVVLDGAKPWVLPGIVVHPGGRHVVWRGVAYTFTRVEGRVLVALAHLWPRPIRGVELTNAAWGPYNDPNLSRVAVQAVRRRAPGLIETVHKCGYRLALGAALATEAGS